MAVDSIRRVFFTPSVAVARLGGSSVPLDAFDWAVGDPHTIAETRIRPAWTLDVAADGSVRPRLPQQLVLRDGPLLRPVAPFLELWALVGDGPEASLPATPVTPELLAANGAAAADLTFSASAMNRKAQRRTGRPELRYGTFTPVTVRSDDHAPAVLRAVSPPDATRPMIPTGRSIPLGSLQVLRPTAQPTGQPWSDQVRVDTVRVRFTPARGRFYGPPAAAQGSPAAVPAERAFLAADAGWFQAAQEDPGNRAVPPDTVDELSPGVSLGVVDDTCDARVTAELTLTGSVLRCRATITVGPPHYAPDRRPFLSLADEINDRQYDPARDAALTDAQRSEWVEDLFERVFETVSALDVDFWRSQRARQLQGAELRTPPIPGDQVPGPEFAMGGADALRDPLIAVPARSPIDPLPLSQRARERHRTLSDSRALASWVLANPDRLRALVRPPLVSPAGEGVNQTMQMPPFMRNSNAGALSLARWQYDLLMSWAESLTASGAPGTLGPGPGAEPAPMSAAAAARRDQVLALLADDDPDGDR
ncbi:MAG: hypothetical protein ACR2GH_04555 [Pseudonocardia sp.]